MVGEPFHSVGANSWSFELDIHYLLGHCPQGVKSRIYSLPSATQKPVLYSSSMKKFFIALRPFFVSSLFLVPLILIGAGCEQLVAARSVPQVSNTTTTVQAQVVSDPKIEEALPQKEKKIEQPSQAPKEKETPAVASPNGTYVNTAGNTVPRPHQAPSAPAGASAKCRDGSYSFSQNRRGTCSHHGGVAVWY